MKIALVITGKPRFVEQGFKYLKKNLIDVNDNVDVYCQFWDNNESAGGLDWKGQVIEDTSNTKEQILDLYKPKSFYSSPEMSFTLPDKDLSFDTGFPQPKELWYKMFWGIGKGLELVKQSGIEYDWIVRTRWDFWLGDALDLTKYHPYWYYTTNTTKKWWMFFDEGAVADVLGFSAPHNMNCLSKMLDSREGIEYLYDRGVRFCQESLLGAHLKDHRIDVKFLRFNNIGIIRNPHQAQCFHLGHMFSI